MKKIVFVLTSHEDLGDTGHKTGFWIEEFAAPYYFLKEKGIEITLASPKGGQPPIDPKSNEIENQTEASVRFNNDKDLQEELSKTKKLSTIKEEDFDGIFYPGGHGPLWDLSDNMDSIKLIEAFYKNNKPVGAVCHAPIVFKNVEIEGKPIVEGKKVTGFSNSEEEAVQLTHIVPYLVEDELVKNGGIYSKANDWESFVQEEGNLITGQNPASSESVAAKLLAKL